MINVTNTFFPNLDEYLIYLKRIWNNEWLTNRGELVKELEFKLKTFLGVDQMVIMNNGTIPIQIALKLLAKNGEVITTPFSYVATTSSIIWENCKPVFVDIDPEFLTIDESKIESAITKNTTAILATHVFGNPCNVFKIEKVALKYNLKVIYDAAHSFGVKYFDKSIFDYGDISTCSFHATKIFHTGEGGAAFSRDKELFDKLYYSHNFGHDGPVGFHGLGINGKISELQAAMGLAVFSHIDEIFNARKKTVELYDSILNFSKIRKMTLRENTIWNYSYYPVIFQSEDDLLRAQLNLNRLNIFPRRYFYPSLNTIKFVNGPKMLTSETISPKILCLPLSHNISELDIVKISKLINRTIS